MEEMDSSKTKPAMDAIVLWCQMCAILNEMVLSLPDPRHHDRGGGQQWDQVSQGRLVAVVPDEDSWIPQRQCAQLHHQLAWRPGLQRHHSQTPVSAKHSILFVCVCVRACMCLSVLCIHVCVSGYQRSFSYAALFVWNRLPCKVRSSNTLTSFKSSFRPNLFKPSCFLVFVCVSWTWRERERVETVLLILVFACGHVFKITDSQACKIYTNHILEYAKPFVQIACKCRG